MFSHISKINLYLLFIFFSNLHAQNGPACIDSLERRVLCDTSDQVQNGNDIALLEFVQLYVEPYKFGDYAADLKNRADITGDKHLLLEYMLVEGIKNFNNNRFIPSFSFAESALNLATSIKDTAYMVRSYTLLAALNNSAFSGNKAGDSQAALRITKASYELSIPYHSAYIKSVAIQNYAFAMMRVGDFAQALRILKQGMNTELDDPIQIKNEIIKFYFYNLSGVCCRQLGNYKESQWYFEMAKSIAEKFSFHALAFLVYSNMATDAFNRNNLKEAETFFLKAYALKNIIAKNKVPFILKNLQLINEKKKNWEIAYKFSNEYSSLNEEINNDEKSKNFIEFQTKYESLEKENKIKSLFLENELIKLQRKKSDMAFYISMIIIGIFLLTIYMIWKAKRALHIEIKKKDLIYSMISHDLRGPVIGIQQVMPLVNQALIAKNNEKVQLLLKNVHINVLNVYNIIENLFNLAKLNRDDKVIKIERFNISDEFKWLLDIFESKIKQKNLKVDLEYEGDAKLATDRFMLNSVVRNVFHNAIKFSNEDGIIKVKISKYPSNCTISITDFGDGIDDQTKLHLFDSLKTISKPGKNEPKGSGIGLDVSRRLIRLVGGDLLYKDETIGTTFVIIIPVK